MKQKELKPVKNYFHLTRPSQKARIIWVVPGWTEKDLPGKKPDFYFRYNPEAHNEIEATNIFSAVEFNPKEPISASLNSSFDFYDLDNNLFHRILSNIIPTPTSILTFIKEYGQLSWKMNQIKFGEGKQENRLSKMGQLVENNENTTIILYDNLAHWQHSIASLRALISAWDLTFRNIGNINLNNLIDLKKADWSKVESQPKFKKFIRMGLDVRWNGSKWILEPGWERGWQDWTNPLKGTVGRQWPWNSNHKPTPRQMKRIIRGVVAEYVSNFFCPNEVTPENYVCPVLVPDGDLFSVSLKPQSLLSAAYLTFLWEIIGITKQKSCAVCGKNFPSTRSNKIYCSPSCRVRASQLRNANKGRKKK